MAKTIVTQVSVLPDREEFTYDQKENEDLLKLFEGVLEARDILILASTVTDNLEAIEEVFRFRLSEFRDQLRSWSNVQL